VYLKDIKDEFVQKGLSTVHNLFDNLVKRKKLTPEVADRRKKLVTGGTSYDGVANVDVIIEAAIERMDIKKQVLQECETKCGENTIFATNTSTLSITELATASKRPENVVGMHFFNPVHKMPLLEIIRGKETSEKTVATIYKLALKLGKIPIIVNDGPGFLVNRILGAYTLEAARMLKEGGDLAQIDNAILEFGLPMGPFRLLDEVGIDVAGHSSSTLESLGARFSTQDVGPVMQKMVQQGYLGKKTGKGFYSYKDGKSQGLEPSLANLVPGYNPSNSKKYPVKDIVDRCVLLMVNEAAYILDEKIAEKPEDVDTGMIFGTGFAPFRGGLLAYADARGIKDIVNRLQELQQKYGDRFKPAPLLVKMANENSKFYPNRPNIPWQERVVPPRARL
jgi:3-hydroxyacyl-CoA dehydrogenase/enoyl-CoA hydratase/3-hydroxybutyryl-CoA epimerase